MASTVSPYYYFEYIEKYLRLHVDKVIIPPEDETARPTAKFIDEDEHRNQSK